METIGLNKQKSSWKIYKATYPDGRVGYVCGDYYNNVANNAILIAHQTAGARTEQVDNVIITAKLVPIKTYNRFNDRILSFRDQESDFIYSSTHQTFLNMLQAIADGKVRVENGAFCGTFTFVKKSTEVSIAVAAEQLENTQELDVSGSLTSTDVDQVFKM